MGKETQYNDGWKGQDIKSPMQKDHNFVNVPGGKYNKLLTLVITQWHKDLRMALISYYIFWFFLIMNWYYSQRQKNK